MKVLFFICTEYTLTMKFYRRTIKIFLGIIIIFSLVFTLVYGKNQISNSQSLGQTEDYKGILTFWHIDSFEGGIGSRKQFLLKSARTFERKNDGVLVMVIEHTEASMTEEISKGNYPDLISFGAGVEISGFSELQIKNGRGGLIGDKSYAVPWCKGGYVLIANPKLTSQIGDSLDSLLVSQAEYTQPLTSLILEGVSAEKIIVKKPMDAYVEFVCGKTPYFLGTQRDISRFERRQMEVISRPIKNFNDIYQYVCVTSSSAQKRIYAEEFIEHLLSQQVQQSLSEIGMFSNIFKVQFNNEHLSKMQDVENLSTVSAFANGKILKQMQENSLQFFNGRKELEIKIKNMLV